METFKTRTLAIRAAAKKFKVNRDVKSVEAVAKIIKTANGYRFVKKDAAPVKKEAAPKKAKGNGVTWSRPGGGTITGRIWELADEYGARALVMAAAEEEEIAPGTASQQYYRWSHREE